MNHKTQDTETLVHDDEWTDDEALSDDDAFADDDRPGDEHPTRPRRRSLPPVAIGLMAVVIAGLGFIGGVQVQKRSGDDAAGGVPAGMAAMMQAGGPGGSGTGTGTGAARGAAGGSGGSSSSTTGEVANVKGSKVYVTTADGSTVEVAVGKTATVQRLSSADVDEIRPGDTVVVTGTTASDGSVEATAVQATASGVSLLGGLGGRGGAAGGAPGSAATASGSGSDAPGNGSDSSGASSSSSSDDASADDAAVDQLFESGD